MVNGRLNRTERWRGSEEGKAAKIDCSLKKFHSEEEREMAVKEKA
jgi:hypothetical protein